LPTYTKAHSILKLKQLAEKTLRPDSTLRKLLLSEPDELPRHLVEGKITIYAKLLDDELALKPESL
jgi:hypothetical protein